MNQDRAILQRCRCSLRQLLLFMAIVAIVIVGLRNWYVYYRIPRSPIAWQDFQQGRVEDLRQRSKGVIVHFTGEWDLTSTWITRSSPMSVFESREVRTAVYQRNFTPILVDITNGEEDRLQLLASLGGKQLPATIVVPPGKDTSPIILGFGFSKTDLLDALSDVSPL